MKFDKIEWHKAFFKTYYERRSFLHLLVNFNRIWVLHISIFWMYTVRFSFLFSLSCSCLTQSLAAGLQRSEYLYRVWSNQTSRSRSMVCRRTRRSSRFPHSNPRYRCRILLRPDNMEQHIASPSSNGRPSRLSRHHSRSDNLHRRIRPNLDRRSHRRNRSIRIRSRLRRTLLGRAIWSSLRRSSNGQISQIPRIANLHRFLPSPLGQTTSRLDRSLGPHLRM